MEDFYVYQLRREDSGLPFYIGKGRGRRIHDHFSPSRLAVKSNKNKVIAQAVKEGVKILREKICENISENGAFLMEVGLISKYGRTDEGTGILSNMSSGAEGTFGRIVKPGKKLSMITKTKISKSLKGKPKSKEACENISLAKSGCKGREWSQESKDKVSNKLKGVVRSEETRAKMKLAAKKREEDKRIKLLSLTNCGS